MLSLSNSQTEPSALLSNARLTIATLIQRPSTVTTSNAFDEFAILDHLIDVSNDVDRCEDGENRKFLNIAQLITASTCIYSRRVDALYKLINTFQSSSSPLSPNKEQEESDFDDDKQSEPVLIHEEERHEPKKVVQEKKKKFKEINRSFICHDLSKISLNPSKTFFVDRTSVFDLKLFQKYVPIGNKQFWINDNQPMIFDLLFDDQLLEMKTEETEKEDEQHQQEPERLIDALNQFSPVIPRATFDDNDIPLPISAYDDHESTWYNETSVDHTQVIEKKKTTKSRKKKIQDEIDLNMFRHGLTDEQQALFRCHKMKALSNKIKTEPTHFFMKTFNRKHFDLLIKDCSPLIVSIFIYPSIIIHHLPIRERYSIKIDQSLSRMIRSPPIPISDVLDDNALVPLSPAPSFIPDMDENIQEDFDIRLQTDMEQMLDAAIYQSNEEQEHSKTFLELRSSIVSYMNKHDSVKTTNAYDLIGSLQKTYSLPLVFSQLLHLCASTQHYRLHSTANDNLFLEKII